MFGRGRQGQVGNIFDVQFDLGLLAAVPPGEEQAVHGLLCAKQGSQVPVECDADGITGLTGVVRETDGLRHDGVKGIITYIDDILLHSREHAQRLKSLEEVLWRLRKYGLKLNVDKTIIGARTVQYLGYTLSGQGVTLSKDKLAAIKDFQCQRCQRL
jgi:hypothetical protein